MNLNYEQHKYNAEEHYRRAETERFAKEVQAWEIVRNSRFLKRK